MIELDERQELLKKQKALLGCLLNIGETPASVDSRLAKVTGRTLLSKRMRGVCRARPDLESFLGERLRAEFVEYARANPSLPHGCAYADSRQFEKYLVKKGIKPKQPIFSLIVDTVRRILFVLRYTTR